MQVMTMADLRVAYLASLEAERAVIIGKDPYKAESLRNLIKNIRSSYLKFAALPDVDIGGMRIAEFSGCFEQLLATLKEQLAAPLGSFSAHASRMRRMLAWAAGGGRFEPPSEQAEHLGYVSLTEFLGPNPNKLGKRLARRFYGYVAAVGLPPTRLDKSGFSEFLGMCGMEGLDLHRALLHFGRNWNRLAAVNRLPPAPVRFPESRKPEPYSAKQNELPPKLRTEILRMSERLRGKDLKGRRGRVPPAKKTVDNCCTHLLQLIGHLTHHAGIVLTGKNLKDIVTLKNVRSLLDYTNDRSIERFGLEQSLPNQRKRFGHTQSMIAGSMRIIAERWIGDPLLIRQLANLHKRIRNRAENRRVSRKNAGRLNDYFRVARALLERSNEPKSGRFKRAIHRRDALIFVLLGVFAYREEMATILRVGQEVLMGEASGMTIRVEKERTKPGLRDLLHEIPADFTFLFCHVVEIVNPILRGKKHSNEALFVSCQGTPLTACGFYRVVTKHTREILGEERYPHLVRYAWITDFLVWSKGDYLNAAHIADTSPASMERHYTRICAKMSVAKFDENRGEAAKRARQKVQEDGL